jgi:hypothetical protein
MKFENWFRVLIQLVMIIVNILAPLLVWYFFFIIEEYKAIALFWAVGQTWIGYSTIKGLIGSDS